MDLPRARASSRLVCSAPARDPPSYTLPPSPPVNRLHRQLPAEKAVSRNRQLGARRSRSSAVLAPDSVNNRAQKRRSFYDVVGICCSFALACRGSKSLLQRIRVYTIFGLIAAGAGCSLTSMSRHSRPVTITTERDRYEPTVHETPGRYGVTRWGTLHVSVKIANRSARTVYPDPCGYHLEERTDSTWVPVYHPVCATGGFPDLIRAGTSVTGGVGIGEQISKEVFPFTFPSVRSTYRLVFELHDAPFRAGTGWGALLPLEQRVSNPFTIEPPRRASS